LYFGSCGSAHLPIVIIVTKQMSFCNIQQSFLLVQSCFFMVAFYEKNPLFMVLGKWALTFWLFSYMFGCIGKGCETG
jgi:hypothetical protein